MTHPRPAVSSGRRRKDARRARPDRAWHARRARAARARHLLPAQEGARRAERVASSPPTRPATSSATRAACAARSSARIEMVALAAAIAIPIGIGVALYLVEFGKKSRFAQVVRYFVDVMTGVPSIVFGLFIYITLVVTGVGGASFAGCKGSLALALLMLPIVTRSAEVVLLLVPDSLREAALALGAPRWKVTFRVVLPTALPGPDHRLAARRRPRHGRDRAAAVHRRRRQRPVVQPRPADELAAGADLRRHRHRPTTAARPARLGMRRSCSSRSCSSSPSSPASLNDGAASHDARPLHRPPTADEQMTDTSRRFPRSESAANPAPDRPHRARRRSPPGARSRCAG